MKTKSNNCFHIIIQKQSDLFLIIKNIMPYLTTKKPRAILLYKYLAESLSNKITNFKRESYFQEYRKYMKNSNKKLHGSKYDNFE